LSFPVCSIIQQNETKITTKLNKEVIMMMMDNKSIFLPFGMCGEGGFVICLDYLLDFLFVVCLFCLFVVVSAKRNNDSQNGKAQ
jgi:hypothetical protein